MGSTWVFTDTNCRGQRMPQAVVEWLSSQGLPTMLVIADEPHRLSTDNPPAGHASADHTTTEGALSGLTPGDPVLARGSGAALRQLLRTAQARGAACLESPDALAALDDPSATFSALEACGLWVPTTFFARSPEDLAGLARELYPLSLTPMEGPRARRRIVRSPKELLASPWRPGGVVAQTRAGGSQVRLLVAGDSVWAQRTGSWAGPRARPSGVRVTAGQRSLAAQCRAALGLELLSLEVADFGGRPMVVDVAPFPEFTGIRDAGAVIGQLLQRRGARARRQAHPTPRQGA